MADTPDVSTLTSPYDRDVLRSQMETLRREAAVRAKLEHEIAAEHDDARAATEKSAREKLAATTQKYTRDIEAAKREYATVLQQIAGQAAAEQKKLDDQRKAFAATILRTAATQQSQLKDDDQYEDASFREICQEKRKDPVRLFAKSEKDLGRTLAHLDERVRDAEKGDRNECRADEIEGRAPLCTLVLPTSGECQRDRDDRKGYVDQEDPAPGERLHDDAAERRAAHGGEARHQRTHRVDDVLALVVGGYTDDHGSDLVHVRQTSIW
jgi:hypothetical protein